MSGELEQLGVRGVDASSIEQQVLAQAQEAGAAPTEPPSDDPAGQLQQLHAVNRELRAVAAAVESFQQQDGQPSEQQDQGQEAEEVLQRSAPATTAGGALQQAVMQQRLAGLEARKQQLQESLAGFGIAPPETQDGAGPSNASQAAATAPHAPPSQQQQQGPRGRAGAQQKPAASGSAMQKGKQKVKQKVQFELDADADIFADLDAAAGRGAGAQTGLVETERDRLIRLGILTPFDRLDGFERRLERGPRQQPAAGPAQTAGQDSDASGGSSQQHAAEAAGDTHSSRQHDSIRRLGEAVRAAKAARPTAILMDHTELPRRDRPGRRIDEGFWRQSSSGKAVPVKRKRRRTLAPAKRARRRRSSGGGGGGRRGNASSDSEEEEEEEEGSDAADSDGGGGSGAEAEGEAVAVAASSGEDMAGEFDDADEGVFEERRAAFLRRQGRQQQRKATERRRLRRNTQAGRGGGGEEGLDLEVVLEDGGGGRGGRRVRVGGAEEAQYERSRGSGDSDESDESEEEDIVFEGGFSLPADLYARLFDYQRTAVKWMWELHTQRAGGIIGDEMGLGKTIQIIAFLAGLHHSGLFRPSLVVCPATVLRQWLRELRAWWPLFRVALLHDSARSGGAGTSRPSRHRLVREIAESDCGILLTTYETMRLQRAELVGVEWGYVVLDEGHKIRNPDAEVTLAAKQMQTVHRLIMSGSPIQNRLTELWSLFDFVFPGKLGTLPVCAAQFALPIQIGGYANASPLQVSTAYKCAVILRDLIAPYLLRRRKADVAHQLPQKTEQVLFCTLTAEQRDLYRGYLASKELLEIFAGSRKALAGIDVLRKICNHPDLLERSKWEAAQDYGNPERGGKMQVLAKVLQHWHTQGHKALVFTQTQQMLDIIEKHAEGQGYTYHRMDGSTSVAQRARLIDDFNTNPDVFCFLLTTRVGGLGVNLTGANRVLLYDPDWNPSTDIQARERAWRIGQKREVVIYRLITSGTIEEKVYHRQVYKHFLTDKVLRDPRQRRFFKAKDLTDLFTLGDEYADGTETASLFASLGTDVIPEEDLAGEEQQAGPASDRDDYESGDGGERRQQNQNQNQQSQQQQQQGQGAPTPAANGRQRRRNSSSSGGHDLPAGAGVRAEQAAPQADGLIEGGGGGGQGDAKILRELFEGSDVRGAIDHSKVEGANDPQRRAADQEAARVARRAAEALRQSRLQCRQAPISEPTWTGRSGAAGLPVNGTGQPPRFGRAANPRLQAAAAQQEQQAAAAVAATLTGSGTARRFGGAAVGGPSGTAGVQAGSAMGAAPRSSDILARLRERQAAAASASAAAAAADPAVELAQQLAAQVALFLESRGGSSPSDDLVAHFQASVGAAQLPVFRGVLKQVAQLQRRPSGAQGKVWVLKPEFASDVNGGGNGGNGDGDVA